MSIGLGKDFKASVLWLALAISLSAAAPAAAQGPDLLRGNCGGCHRESGGRFDRISSIRKTPEGWLMTLFRMRQVHGLTLDTATRDALVRYLSDTQGLAPAEAAPGRFALERRPNVQDIDLGGDMAIMCGRCHTLARAALQRRDEDEWRKLAHTHIGQWPSIEYSASGRDRPWMQLATGPLPGKLAALYPFSTTAWTDWQKRKPVDLSGQWVVVGRVPGGKDFYGTAQIERDSAGDYKARYVLTDVAGSDISGDSSAVVYTGYEWRGKGEIGGHEVREVYALAEDGTRLSGRWFDPDHAEDGGEWVAVRLDATPQVIAVLPQSIRTGSTQTVTVVGTGLGSKPAALALGDGLVATAVGGSEHVLQAQVKVAADAVPGVRSVTAGTAVGHIAVYRQIDKLEVTPAYGIARVGGGRTAPVFAQFEAAAFSRLPSGEWLPLGPVRAGWSSVPFDAEAKRTEDEKFAGHFDQRGRFLPAGAGPNPAREYSGDNVGNLAVVAVVDDGGRAVEARGHLIVTVQRWNTPPIY